MVCWLIENWVFRLTRFDRSIYLKNLFDNSELHRYIYEIDYGDITATAGNYVSFELYLLSYIVHNIISVSLSKPFQSRDIGGVVGDDGVGIVECVYFIRTNRRLFNARTYKLDSIGGGRKRKRKRNE
jgi:hypothetical protein